MPYINTTTLQFPLSETDIKEAYPNVSFSVPFTPPAGYAVVFESPKPEYNPVTSYVHEVVPSLINGKYYRSYAVAYFSPEVIEANEANKLAQERERLKEERTLAVENIKVTTQAGNTFDGDEVSQGRMVRAIVALQATGVPAINWVLADNTAIMVTAPELVEALALAGAAQAAIWVI